MAPPAMMDNPDGLADFSAAEQLDTFDTCDGGEEADRCRSAFRSWSLQVACRCTDLW